MHLWTDQTLSSSSPLSEQPRPGLGKPKRTDRLSRVARRAHELFVARGMALGHDMEDWLEAERQVDAQGDVDGHVTWRR